MINDQLNHYTFTYHWLNESSPYVNQRLIGFIPYMNLWLKESITYTNQCLEESISYMNLQLIASMVNKWSFASMNQRLIESVVVFKLFTYMNQMINLIICFGHPLIASRIIFHFFTTFFPYITGCHTDCHTYPPPAVTSHFLQLI